MAEDASDEAKRAQRAARIEQEARTQENANTQKDAAQGGTATQQNEQEDTGDQQRRQAQQRARAQHTQEAAGNKHAAQQRVLSRFLRGPRTADTRSSEKRHQPAHKPTGNVDPAFGKAKARDTRRPTKRHRALEQREMNRNKKGHGKEEERGASRRLGYVPVHVGFCLTVRCLLGWLLLRAVTVDTCTRAYTLILVYFLDFLDFSDFFRLFLTLLCVRRLRERKTLDERGKGTSREATGTLGHRKRAHAKRRLCTVFLGSNARRGTISRRAR
ncbi:hypothetical protein ERJ75_001397700 [Trypanosoma vivax]|nr:hypothetical protein ERJ75_001397700 [Trypanosoma vivax]